MTISPQLHRELHRLLESGQIGIFQFQTHEITVFQRSWRISNVLTGESIWGVRNVSGERKAA
jgi:hypothetical protein